MNEQSFISAVAEISNTLGQLALQVTEPDDPLAYPEPRGADEIATFEQHLTTLRENLGEQADPKYNSLLNTSLRDYKAGYPDRVGAYIVEFLDKLKQEPSYAQNFSAASQSQLGFYLTDLREL